MVAWGPAAAWAAVLFLVSELQGVPRVVWFALNDKLVHVALYTVLGAGLAWGKRWSDSRIPHWTLLLLGLAYGAVDEWHQRFVPGRIPSVADFVADAVGVFLGYLVVMTCWELFARFRSVLSA